jgi:NAD(P)-dependent dehydrogenase (short-subunit alcohol dehydrogenase family)
VEEEVQLAEKAALITGGSSGIGLAVARALGEDGYGVTVSARRPDKLEAAAAELRDAGLEVHAIAANMTDEDDIKRMVAEHVEHFGRLDFLMNNAGLGIGGAIADMETKKLDMQIAVNLRAVYLVTREATPKLKEAGANGGAMIVNTASIAAKQPQGWLAAYSATKAGVVALTEATAKEIANDGVRCTSICPGFVDTPMTEWIRGQVAQADMIRPEDVAEVVRCLLRLSPACMIPEVMMIRPADLLSAAGP